MVIGGKSPLTKRLRKFKYFDGDLVLLGSAAAGELALKLENVYEKPFIPAEAGGA